MSTITLQAPINSTGFAYAGTSYIPDADGMIDFPSESLPIALSHGFTVPAEKPKSDQKLTLKPKKPAKEDADKAPGDGE